MGSLFACFSSALSAPIFHAIYKESEIIVGIEPVRIISGEAPDWVRQMVVEWALEHERELLSNWNRCGKAQAPLAIAPLA